MELISFDVKHDGLCLILSESHGQEFCQIWVRGKTRKETKCCLCWKVIEKGALAYRPMTNYDNRANRLHPFHIEQEHP